MALLYKRKAPWNESAICAKDGMMKCFVVSDMLAQLEKEKEIFIF
jgi:hypothetical protein